MSEHPYFWAADGPPWFVTPEELRAEGLHPRVCERCGLALSCCDWGRMDADARQLHRACVEVAP